MEYRDVTRQAIKVQRILRELPVAVAVPDSTNEQFLRAVHVLQRSREEAGHGYLADAMESLNRARVMLTNVQTDPLLAEPPDFPMEQYLAIFAPLLFPLLVPMLVTLLREYKQYRDKVKKEKQT